MNADLYFANKSINGIDISVIVSDKGIKKIYLNYTQIELNSLNAKKIQLDDSKLFGIFEQLEEYFDGNRKEFNLMLDIEGSEFQKKVWNEVKKIKYGLTSTYKQIAESLGDLNLIRAVGKANAANPLPIVIPCHRVIGNDGQLVGYAGGLELKEKLLQLEGSRSLDLFK